MDRVVLINLESRPDRLERCRNRLQIPFEIFKAIRPIEADGFPTVGQRGCFLSHYEIVKNHKFGDLLILEDDVVFRDDWMDVWQTIKPKLESRPWDIFYFGSRLKSYHLDDGLIRLIFGYGTHAILINKNSIDKVKSSYEELLGRRHKEHIDVWLNKSSVIKFCHFETLAIQEAGFSDADDCNKGLPRNTFHSSVDEIMFRRHCKELGP